jgi:RNA polymerase-binding protein DksA
MNDYTEMTEQLGTRLKELLVRAEVIAADLRHPLDDDWSKQAIDLADDEALAGIDDVLRAEIQQIQFALLRIRNGTYGKCAKCGEPISIERLAARPIATMCIKCASSD